MTQEDCRIMRVESREQRAESREQRAESREQRAESREQRAESREQKIKPFFISAFWSLLFVLRSLDFAIILPDDVRPLSKPR